MINLCGLLLFTFNAFAVPESQVLNQMTEILQERTFYKLGYFETQTGLGSKSIQDGKKLKIYYVKYGHQKGRRGSVVIVTGRTESSLKYVEVAYDLIQKGFSPVYAIDHRGQGFSSNVSAKKLPDDQIGHVEKFNHYVLDFTQFVNQIVLADPQIDQTNLFLLSNSLGSAIAIRYFQQHPTNPFKKAALSGSMIKIKTNDPLALIKTVAICSVTDVVTISPKYNCYGYTPGESPTQMKTKEVLPNGEVIFAREFHGDDKTYPRNLTSSWARFRLNDYVFYTWPATLVGGPSIKWMEQALTVESLVRSRSLLQKVHTPIFLLIADRDFRAENAPQNKVCRDLQNCVLKHYDSYHEILMETDSIRTPAMEDIFHFFLAK